MILGETGYLNCGKPDDYFQMRSPEEVSKPCCLPMAAKWWYLSASERKQKRVPPKKKKWVLERKRLSLYIHSCFWDFSTSFFISLSCIVSLWLFVVHHCLSSSLLSSARAMLQTRSFLEWQQLCVQLTMSLRRWETSNKKELMSHSNLAGTTRNLHWDKWRWKRKKEHREQILWNLHWNKRRWKRKKRVTYLNPLTSACGCVSAAASSVRATTSSFVGFFSLSTSLVVSLAFWTSLLFLTARFFFGYPFVVAPPSWFTISELNPIISASRHKSSLLLFSLAASFVMMSFLLFSSSGSESSICTTSRDGFLAASPRTTASSTSTSGSFLGFCVIFVTHFPITPNPTAATKPIAMPIVVDPTNPPPPPPPPFLSQFPHTLTLSWSPLASSIFSVFSFLLHLFFSNWEVLLGFLCLRTRKEKNSTRSA